MRERLPWQPSSTSAERFLLLLSVPCTVRNRTWAACSSNERCAALRWHHRACGRRVSMTFVSYSYDWLVRWLAFEDAWPVLLLCFACIFFRLLAFAYICFVLAFALAKCCLYLVNMIDYPFRILILLHNSAWSIVRTTFDLFLCFVRFLHNFRHFSLKMKIIVNFSLHFHLVPFWRDVLRPI